MKPRRLFDRYLIVDWSGSSVPKRGRDSIWICLHGETIANPPTRHEAFELILEILANAQDRILAGFDFAFGYPSGFAKSLALTNNPPWLAAWKAIAAAIEEDTHNANNRFDVAAEFNRRISSGPAPFWACPARYESQFLRNKKPQNPPLPEFRMAERQSGAKSVWMLYNPGSVGSQTLLGIPRVLALRTHPKLADHVAVWPFEPHQGKPFVFAEVYPSLLSKGGRKPHDRDEVVALAARYAEMDARGALAPALELNQLACPQIEVVRAEEGWILRVD